MESGGGAGKRCFYMICVPCMDTGRRLGMTTVAVGASEVRVCEQSRERSPPWADGEKGPWKQIRGKVAACVAARFTKQCGPRKRDDHACVGDTGESEVRHDSGMRYLWRHVWPPLRGRSALFGASHVGMLVFYHSRTTISAAPEDLHRMEAWWAGRMLR